MPNVGPVELIVIFLLFLVPALILYVLIRALARGGFGRERRLEADLGAEVIRERFARGEITREDAEAGMRALGRDLGSRPSGR